MRGEIFLAGTLGMFNYLVEERGRLFYTGGRDALLGSAHNERAADVRQVPKVVAVGAMQALRR